MCVCVCVCMYVGISVRSNSLSLSVCMCVCRGFVWSPHWSNYSSHLPWASHSTRPLRSHRYLYYLFPCLCLCLMHSLTHSLHSRIHTCRTGGAAVNAGVTRGLSVAIIVFELTGQLSYVVPVLVSLSLPSVLHLSLTRTYTRIHTGC